MLDFFDVSLPRGDSVGVTGALCAAAVVVLGPYWAAAVAATSAFLSHVIRRGTEAPKRLATVLLSRGAGLLAAAIGRHWMAGRGFSSTLSYMLVPAVFLISEFVCAQSATALITGRPVIRLLSGNLNSQAPLVAAQWSASVLLLLTHDGMSNWSLLPTVVLLLLIRQSYSLFLDIRETYRTTVEVLVEAAESQDVRRTGHADRTAALARSIAMKAGLPAAEVERISFAALLHDIGALAEQPLESTAGEVRHATSADIVHGVEFFDRIEPVLRVCEGELGDSPEEDLLAGLIVVLASDIDAEYHPDVRAAHRSGALNNVSQRVAPSVKARAVGAALRLGYRIPAVS